MLRLGLPSDTGAVVGARRRDIVCAVSIVACGTKLTWDIQAVTDVVLADPTRYLSQGVYLLQRGLPSPEWGPLYAVWYYLLSLTTSDRIGLYYLNYSLLIVLPPLLVYAYLRRIHVSSLLALLASLTYLVSGANNCYFPYVTKFAAVVILAFLIGSTYAPSRWRWSLAVVGILAAAFVRPEFALSFALLAGGGVVSGLWRTFRYGMPAMRDRLLPAGAVVLMALVAVLVIGNPIQPRRSLAAFRQHFAWHYVRWHGLALSPWTEAHQVWRAAFGDAKTIPGAFKENPKPFLRHLRENARLLLPQLHRVALLRLPGNVAPKMVAEEARGFELALILQAVVLAAVLNRRRREDPLGSSDTASSADDQERAPPEEVRKLTVVLAAVLPPAIISCVLVWPREHYLIVPVVLGLLLLTASLSRGLARLAWWPERGSSSWIAVALVGSVALLCIPNWAHGWSLLRLRARGNAVTDTRDTLVLLRGLSDERTIGVIWPCQCPERRSVYLKGRARFVQPSAADGDFGQVVSAEDVDAIVWPERLLRDARFSRDASLRALLQEPERHGFRVAWASKGPSGKRVLARPELGR